MPITMAVSGSMAPKSDVVVGPIYLMACTRVMLEMAVAGRAMPSTQSHIFQPVTRRMPPSNSNPQQPKSSAPKAVT